MPPIPKQRQKRRKTFLKEWREHRQLTQAQAAERLQIDQSTLSRIERGDIPYNQDFLESAAFAYRCEPADLIMRNPLDKDAVWSITDNLRTASPDVQAQIRAVVEALVTKAG